MAGAAAGVSRLSSTLSTLPEDYGIENFCRHIKEGDLEWVQRALYEDDESLLSGYSSKGYTPLATAIIYGHIKIAQYLIEKGADKYRGYSSEHRTCNLKDSYFEGFLLLPPLHLACCDIRCKDITKLLVQSGVGVDDTGCIDAVGRPLRPLNLADAGSVVLLLGLGAQINEPPRTSQEGMGQWPPLFSAIDRGDINVIDTLCQNGAAVQAHSEFVISYYLTPDENTANSSRHEEKITMNALGLVAWRAAHGWWPELPKRAGAMVKTLVRHGARVDISIFRTADLERDPRLNTLQALCYILSEEWAVRHRRLAMTRTALEVIRALVAAGSDIGSTAQILARRRLPTADFALRKEAIGILNHDSGAVSFSGTRGLSSHFGVFSVPWPGERQADFEDGFSQLIELSVELAVKELSRTRGDWFSALPPLRQATALAAAGYSNGTSGDGRSDLEEAVVSVSNLDEGTENTLSDLRWQAVRELLRWMADHPFRVDQQEPHYKHPLYKRRDILWSRIEARGLFEKYEKLRLQQQRVGDTDQK